MSIAFKQLTHIYNASSPFPYTALKSVDLEIENGTFCVIIGETGTVIGKPEGKFYNDVTELVDIPSGATSIRQPVSIEDDYHGNSITITALHPETNATLSTLKLNFEND